MNGTLHAFILLVVSLAGCSVPAQPPAASDQEIVQASYRSSIGPEIRLYTVVSRRNGSGAHSGLMIATDRERILFDPAGTFSLADVPERGDVHYGISPAILDTYIDYHARETFDVVEQSVRLSSDDAEQIAQYVKVQGAVPRMQCALSITRILARLPRFEGLGITYFPNTAMRAVAKLPGAKTRVIRQNDSDANHDVLIQAAATP
ncbi:MAG: hypothetical protein AAF222_05800 [Pseudomonadota bacterium]